LKNRIAILDLPKGIESSVSLPNGCFANLEIGWTPDDKGLLLSGAQDGCFLARAGLDGKSTVLLRGGFNQCYSNPTASPDGRNLAFAQYVFNDNAWLLENF
jgi:Tol biopolymer transport system component